MSELHTEATTRLRGVAAGLVKILPADDVAGMFLVQSIAVMGLNKDKTLVAEWLRELADEVETVGTVSDQQLN